ncbi:hypothetical protein PRIC1_007065 [Phytophthora ramorum]|uniref:uncharacterized protein n=1 Tax=Phytophthora ramorum TaxID=164328 RepID=UPI0030A85BE2|nr:hypothetical protein KRP23_2723 [Phytophthora ramorum]KAH7501937.1 hypothetical protein KRP22_7411 [Phytophthora ramorum]
MRLAYVVVAAVATLFASADAVSPVADPNQSKLFTVHTPDVARVLNVEDEIAKPRFLRAEGNADTDDEERALPASLTKLTDKLKPVAEKVKPLSKKLTPYAEKLTDKAMAAAVRLKPIADKFSGKLKPIADKLLPILKPIAAKLNTVPFINRVVKKLKEFAQKVKNTKVGEATVSQRYTMAKFELWFKQNKSPDEVKAMLKVGAGPIVNTKDYDLWNQYSVFYKISLREKETKANIP